MRSYGKLLAQVLATVLAALIAALIGDNVIDAVEWVNVAALAVGVLAVYTGPNVPGARFTKALMSALATLLVLLATLIVGGLDTAEWLQLAVAALGTVGVYALPGPTDAIVPGSGPRRAAY